MKRKFISVSVVSAALVAVGLVPTTASATKPVLTQPLGTPVATGTSITGTNVGSILFTTSLGTVTCKSGTLSGTLKTNSTVAGVEGEISSASFIECSSWIGPLTFTTNLAINGTPWCVSAVETGHLVRLRGGACGSARPIRFTLDFGGFIGTCTYERLEAAIGSVRTNGSGEFENTAAISNQTWKKLAGGGGSGCPSSGGLDMTFSLENGSGPINIQ